MDWVPAYQYGQTISLLADEDAVIPLMDPAVWALQDEVVGRIEDQSAYQLLRLIGYFGFATAGAPPVAGQVVHRLLPCFQDQLNSVPVPPGPLLDPTLPEVHNEKFWAERRHGAQWLTTNVDEYQDPYNQVFDRMYDQSIGEWIPDNMVPCWQIANATGNSLRCVHYFRMLIGRTAGA